LSLFVFVADESGAEAAALQTLARLRAPKFLFAIKEN